LAVSSIIEDFPMSKWLTTCAFALLLATPALAQSDAPDRFGGQQPQGSEAAKPAGDVTPGAAAETKSSGQPAAGATTPRSGAGGITPPADRAAGASKPAEDSTEAYKNDFKKK
jgi:hypothetical protein